MAHLIGGRWAFIQMTAVAGTCSKVAFDRSRRFRRPLAQYKCRAICHVTCAYIAAAFTLRRIRARPGKIEISRSFGDALYKRSGMSAVPDVKIFDILSPRDQFLLLGCDGFWGVFAPEDAVAFAARLLKDGSTAKHVCNRLINEVGAGVPALRLLSSVLREWTGWCYSRVAWCGSSL